MRAFTLPSGRRVSVLQYLIIWHTCRTCERRGVDPAVQAGQWDAFPTTASRTLRDLRAGLHDRINRQLPHFGQGRKWSDDWQLNTSRAARELNTPRLRIHYLPPHLRARFGHRLAMED